VAAVLLLVPATAPVGGALAVGLMSGAILSHLTVLGIEVRGDGGLLFALAVLVWLAGASVVWIYRGLLPVIGPVLAASGARS
jgi:putative oxidoreductase